MTSWQRAAAWGGIWDDCYIGVLAAIAAEPVRRS
jgi:hypothetical protein